MLCHRCVYASAKVICLSWKGLTCSATGVYMLLPKVSAFLGRGPHALPQVCITSLIVCLTRVSYYFLMSWAVGQQAPLLTA